MRSESLNSTRDRITQFIAGWVLGSVGYWIAFKFSESGCFGPIFEAAGVSGPLGNVLGVIGVDLISIWKRPKPQEFEYRYQSIDPLSIVLALVLCFGVGIPISIISLFLSESSLIIAPFITCIFAVLGYHLRGLIRGFRG